MTNNRESGQSFASEAGMRKRSRIKNPQAFNAPKQPKEASFFDVWKCEGYYRVRLETVRIYEKDIWAFSRKDARRIAAAILLQLEDRDPGNWHLKTYVRRLRVGFIRRFWQSPPLPLEE